MPIGTGVFLIGLGLVKKVVIADFLARHVVDPTFAVPEAYGAPDMWLAIYCYAAQIYCDFSGYTDIAIGLALLMGYVFPRNFHSPYRASSFRDFWRRWHMTLSRYLRDFLYIPLGGNRKGKWGTARNLMITMLLGGLWHGAAWGFVLWGGLHGLYLGAERILRGRFKPLPTWLGWFVVLNLVVLGVDPVPRARPRRWPATFFARLFHPGALTLLSPGVVIALLARLRAAAHPRAPGRGRPRLVREPEPRRARPRAGGVRRDRRRDRPRPGRSPVHLLPVLMRHRPRDLLICCGIAVVLLTLAEGRSVRHAGREMPAGWERSLVLAVGHPAGWITDQIPVLADAANQLGKAFKGSNDLAGGGAGSFSDAGARAAAGGVQPVTPDAFDPRTLGEKPPPPRPLKTLLVTGDSMSQPLDAELARSLTPKGIKVVRDAHVGTGISDTSIVDWGKLSISQVKKDEPDAVVMFMGANEGFPMQVGKPPGQVLQRGRGRPSTPTARGA